MEECIFLLMIDTITPWIYHRHMHMVYVIMRISPLFRERIIRRLWLHHLPLHVTHPAKNIPVRGWHLNAVDLTLTSRHVNLSMLKHLHTLTLENVRVKHLVGCDNIQVLTLRKSIVAQFSNPLQKLVLDGSNVKSKICVKALVITVTRNITHYIDPAVISLSIVWYHTPIRLPIFTHLRFCYLFDICTFIDVTPLADIDSLHLVRFSSLVVGIETLQNPRLILLGCYYKYVWDSQLPILHSRAGHQLLVTCVNWPKPVHQNHWTLMIFLQTCMTIPTYNHTKTIWAGNDSFQLPESIVMPPYKCVKVL